MATTSSRCVRDPASPQSARDVFELLARGGWIDPALADALKRLERFRNIALHDDQSLQLPITVRFITDHLDDLLRYSQALLLCDGATGRVTKEFRLEVDRAEIFRCGDEIVLRERPLSATAIFDALAALPPHVMSEVRDDTPPQEREAF